MIDILRLCLNLHGLCRSLYGLCLSYSTYITSIAICVRNLVNGRAMAVYCNFSLDGVTSEVYELQPNRREPQFIDRVNA